jgi:hypothetical protein
MSEDLLNTYHNRKEKAIKYQRSIMKTSTLDIICATEFEEFFYEGTEELVLEGDPVGVDIETEEGVELVLFNNIYWSPPFDE